MAIKVLVVEQRPTEYYFKMHIDDSKLVGGAPDPAYVREFHWGKDVSAAVIKTEMKLLCLDALAKMAAPGAVAGVAVGDVL